MGHGIAQVFAGRGYQVCLYSRSAETLKGGMEKIKTNLEFLAQNGLGSREQIAPTLQRIRTTQDVAEAVREAHFVLETVVENLSIKQDLFQQIDGLCPPETILATNTSVMSITQIASKCSKKERVVGAHFWNPPFLIPLVEVVPGEQTAPTVVDQTYELLKDAGKHPVRVKKDVPGFVANRMQHALWREAVSIVENGIADAATVDECVKYSFGLRLPVLAPLENADLVGTDLTLAIHDYVLKHIESSPAPSPYLRGLVADNRLGFKTGSGFLEWDEEKIAAVRERLLKHLVASLKNSGESSQ